nr:FAD:protein FMN transferase [Companilactobacillus zhongbaensis]
MHNDVGQVTIITDNSEQAEILSTVCFFKGKDDGLNLIEKLPNVEAVYVDSNNAVFHSSGLKKAEEGVLVYE